MADIMITLTKEEAEELNSVLAEWLGNSAAYGHDEIWCAVSRAQGRIIDALSDHRLNNG